jgi:hypothetical protein
MDNGFIYTTSLDYCIDYEIVERFYRIYGNGAEFYEKLESYIKERN